MITMGKPTKSEWERYSSAYLKRWGRLPPEDRGARPPVSMTPGLNAYSPAYRGLWAPQEPPRSDVHAVIAYMREFAAKPNYPGGKPTVDINAPRVLEQNKHISESNRQRWAPKVVVEVKKEIPVGAIQVTNLPIPIAPPARKDAGLEQHWHAGLEQVTRPPLFNKQERGRMLQAREEEKPSKKIDIRQQRWSAGLERVVRTPLFNKQERERVLRREEVKPSKEDAAKAQRWSAALAKFENTPVSNEKQRSKVSQSLTELSSTYIARAKAAQQPTPSAQISVARKYARSFPAYVRAEYNVKAANYAINDALNTHVPQVALTISQLRAKHSAKPTAQVPDEEKARAMGYGLEAHPPQAGALSSGVPVKRKKSTLPELTFSPQPIKYPKGIGDTRAINVRINRPFEPQVGTSVFGAKVVSKHELVLPPKSPWYTGFSGNTPIKISMYNPDVDQVVKTIQALKADREQQMQAIPFKVILGGKKEIGGKSELGEFDFPLPGDKQKANIVIYKDPRKNYDYTTFYTLGQARRFLNAQKTTGDKYPWKSNPSARETRKEDEKATQYADMMIFSPYYEKTKNMGNLDPARPYAGPESQMNYEYDQMMLYGKHPGAIRKWRPAPQSETSGTRRLSKAAYLASQIPYTKEQAEITKYWGAPYDKRAFPTEEYAGKPTAAELKMPKETAESYEYKMESPLTREIEPSTKKPEAEIKVTKKAEREADEIVKGLEETQNENSKD